METFYGSGHIPGTPEPQLMELHVDWTENAIEVRLPKATQPLHSWPGLLVQTFGTDEAVFRTKGIHPLGTHWWHMIRYSRENLLVMVLGLPDTEGAWPTCSFELKKIEI